MLKLLKVLCWIQFQVFFYCTVNAQNPMLHNVYTMIEDNRLLVAYTCTAQGKVGDFLTLYKKKGDQETEIRHTQLSNDTTIEMETGKTVAFESSDEGSKIYCVLTDELGKQRRESNKDTVQFSDYFDSFHVKIDHDIETGREDTEENNVLQRDYNHENPNDSPAKANFTDNDTDFKHGIANHIDNTENATYFNHSKANKNIETLFHGNADLAFDEKLNHEKGTFSAFSNLYTLVISLLVIVLAIALLGVWLIRRRSHLPPSEEEQKEDEGIYTTAQVTYAVLDLQNSTTDYVSVPAADGQTPYAKIIGVYKPDLK